MAREEGYTVHMTIAKLIAIALIAAVLATNTSIPIAARFILLGALLIGSYLWLHPDEEDEEEQDKDQQDDTEHHKR
jgi:flagellar biosynthesis component FlhA